MPPPSRIGPYEILGPLGAGGMGEVYKARDTKLDREAAIKILPKEFAQDPERLARFEREAKALAALNHPNIAQVYGLEEGPALAMELIKGEPIKGPMSESRVLDIAKQIASGLDAAHERGIVHRDLKPGNILITADGGVKILDFGLATVIQPAAQDPENSPTLTLGATIAGAIMGTAAYMSPEQASGKQVDKRSDIWSFGVVLYEIATGKSLYAGETVSHILANVLTQQPDLATLPPQVRSIVSRCLEKDPKKRLRDIGDAFLAEAKPEPKPAKIWPWLVLAAASLAAGWLIKPAPENKQPLVTTSILAPENVAFHDNEVPALSPDGRYLAFIGDDKGKRSHWVRDIATGTAKQFPHTDGAQAPFWSPDSKYIGYSADRKLMKIASNGGFPETITAAQTSALGASWGESGVIIYPDSNRSGLMRVDAFGGTPLPLTKLGPKETGVTHRYPHFLPGGRYFLYSNVFINRRAEIRVGDLQSDLSKVLPVQPSSNAIYLESGYIAYMAGQVLVTQHFDLKSLTVSGAAGPLAEQVGALAGAISPRGKFTASTAGAVAFVRGASEERIQNTWFDRSGNILGRLGPAKEGSFARLAPDDSRMATYQLDPATLNWDIWLFDPRTSAGSRLTFEGSNIRPAWSPDGSRIVFRSARQGLIQFRSIAVGTNKDEVFAAGSGERHLADWARDGGHAVLASTGAISASDISVMEMSGAKTITPYAATEANEFGPRISPDSRWLAYVSDASKRDEVFVGSFPKPGAKFQISTEGGAHPVWSRDGRELYYFSPDSKLMAVSVKSGNGTFSHEAPRPLFTTNVPPIMQFDVSRDGRFLIPVIAETPGPPASVTLIQNWTELIKK